MTHILLIIDFFPPHKGGVETVFDNVTQRLLKKGYKMTVVTTRHDSTLPQQEKKENLTIHRVGSSRINFLRYGYRKSRELLKNDRTIDFIHTSTYGAAIPAALVAKQFRKKILITVHEIFGKLRYRYKGKLAGRAYHVFEKIIFAFRYDSYLCVSRYTLNSLRVHYGIADSKLHLVHNGISEQRKPQNTQSSLVKQQRAKYAMDDKYTILYYGHGGISKGIDHYVDAVPTIIKKHPDVLLLFVFIPARRTTSLIQKLKSYNFPQNIVIEPNGLPFDELRHAVAAVDVVIAPSLSEGFGSVVSEVSQLGQKLITTQVSAIPEAAFGEVMFIRSASSQAIIDAVSRAKQGEGFQSIPNKDYNRDANVEKLEKLYQNMMSG